MQNLESTEEKVQAICHRIKEEALEPAKKQAAEIILEAKKEKEKLIAEAQEQANQIIEESRRAQEKQKQVFESSLVQAARQAISVLQEKIEKSLFDSNVNQLIDEYLSQDQVVGQLLAAIIHAVEKQGLDVNLNVEVPKSINKKELLSVILARCEAQLKEGDIALNEIQGGCLVTLRNKNITLDMSDLAIKELLSTYLRKDFRHYLFQES